MAIDFKSLFSSQFFTRFQFDILRRLAGEVQANIDWDAILNKPVVFPPGPHTHDAADIVTGQFANARISQSSVTQHQAALAIAWSQITSKPTTLAGYGITDAVDTFSAQIIGGNKTFTSNVTFAANIVGGINDWRIFQPTSDGADDRRIIIHSGGAVSNTRGAYLLLQGNEYAGGGIATLAGGLNANILIAAAGSGNINITSTTGTLTFNANNVWHAGNFDPASKLDIGLAWTLGISASGTQVPNVSSAFDLDTTRGFHAIYANSTVLNKPSAGNGSVWGFTAQVGGQAYGVQEWARSGRRFVRTIDANVAGAWSEYYTTANLTPGDFVLKTGDTMTGQLLRTIAGMANNTSQLWLRAYSDNLLGEASISYTRGAVSSHGGMNFNVANGAANNVTPLRLTPASGIPVFTTRVHNMTGAVSNQSILRYMGWNNEVNRWSEVMESSGPLAYYSYDAAGASESRMMYLRGPSMGTKEVVVDSARLVVDQGDIYTYRTGGTTGVIFLRSDATRYLYFDGTTYAMPGATLVLNGGGVEAAGRVLFATSSATVGLLGTHPALGTNYAALMGSAMTGQEYAMLFGRAGNDTNTYISSVTGGTVKVRPSANSTTGEVTFATTGVTFAQACTGPNFTATSDRRLKHDDGVAELYDKLDTLRIHDFRWKKGNGRGRGPMAQDVQKVAPAYVFERDGILSIDKGGLALEVALLALRLALQRKQA